MSTKTLRQLVDEWRAADEEQRQRANDDVVVPNISEEDMDLIKAALAPLGAVASVAIALAQRVALCTDPMLIDAADVLLRDLRDTRRRPIEDFLDLGLDIPPRAAAGLASVLADSIERHALEVGPS